MAAATALLVATPAAPADEGLTTSRIRTAVERSLPPIIAGGVSWMEKMKCVSCHRTAVMSWTLTEANRQGFTVDNAKLDEWTDWSIGNDSGIPCSNS